MQIVTLDFETYFDDDYSLRKMSTEAYIRDPRFQALGVGIRWGAGAPLAYAEGELNWYAGEDLDVLQAIDWENTAVLCHHAHLDGLILSHHYGVKPRVYLDTLSMARVVIGNHLSVGLDNLAQHFALRGKTVPYDAFKGKTWAELDDTTRRLVADGCLHDVELTWQLFNILAKGFPAEEYPAIDMTVRMFTEPQFTGDTELLGKVWYAERDKKNLLLSQLQVTPGDLQSSERFAELLRREGVEPATKPSQTQPEKRNYAFAKTDDFMKELLDDDNERVRSLAEARLGVKSTLDQTRAERLGDMAARGKLAVYLNYAGAHTTRWSGGDSTNFQNFKRGSDIRKSMVAPAGCRIVKADKSQIECRILNFVAGQEDVIERFRAKEDPYIGIASEFYGRPITKSDAAERGVGKQLELSCGYGAGAATIAATARRGTYGPPVILTEHDALAARDLYRATHAGVVDLWNYSDWCLGQMTAGASVTWRDVIEIKGRTAYLPNGLPLHYPEMQWDHELPQNGGRTGGYKYKTRKGWKTKGVWGGFIVENFIQALSRVDMSQSLLRILKTTGVRPAILEHDAAAWIIPEKDVDDFSKVVKEEMIRAPTWLPDIPLDAELSTGERYS